MSGKRKSVGERRGVRRLWLWAWLPVTISLLVATGAGWAILSLHRNADATEHSRELVAAMVKDLEGPEGLLLSGTTPTGTTADPHARPKTSLPFHAVSFQDGNLSTLNGLRRTADPRLVNAVVRNIDAMGHGQDMLATGGPVVLVAEQHAHAIVGSLQASLAALLRDRTDAARFASRLSDVSTMLIMLLAALIVTALAIRGQALARQNARLLAASQVEALVDPLTGLRNRRSLMNDLDVRHASPHQQQPALALFDLNGFKEYNDTFGHPAGDALLVRLSDRLAATLENIGTAYRMGGDEFCVLADVDDDGATVSRLAAAALSEDGDAFQIDCSYGVALLTGEVNSFEDALRLADQRMYEQKAGGRASPSRQTADALVAVLGERSVELQAHITDVSRIAELTAERLGLSEHEVRTVKLGAELHDVGKAAIPDAILNKPGKLDPAEWEFVRRHTVIGERIVRAAPSLALAADIVRSTHEQIDGSGYPDGLTGDQIPLGARIVAICDAFDAIVSDRPYRAGRQISEALDELRRCAGTQFDTHIVAVFCDVIADQIAPANRHAA